MSDFVALPQRDIVRLTWTPPFSLDITGVDPDIWYHVEVYNVTAVRRVPLTNLTVYKPEFNFTVPDPSPCDQFEFRVTPVNVVGNGTSSDLVGGYFLRSKFSYWSLLCSNFGRLTFLKETARSQEWLVQQATNAHQTMSHWLLFAKNRESSKLVCSSTCCFNFVQLKFVWEKLNSRVANFRNNGVRNDQR